MQWSPRQRSGDDEDSDDANDDVNDDVIDDVIDDDDEDDDDDENGDSGARHRDVTADSEDDVTSFYLGTYLPAWPSRARGELLLCARVDEKKNN